MNVQWLDIIVSTGVFWLKNKTASKIIFILNVAVFNEQNLQVFLTTKTWVCCKNTKYTRDGAYCPTVMACELANSKT